LRQVERHIKRDISHRGSICFPLIDTENLQGHHIKEVCDTIAEAGASAVLIGGSTISDQVQLDKVTALIRRNLQIPIILFPGNITGITRHADAILFLSLLNSENPYFIVQAQALAAATIRQWNLEVLPTAYIIVGEGATTGFIGHARGIPPTRPKIAAMYALAAQYMGMRFVYLEAGSGATEPVTPEMVNLVRKSFSGVLIVGGGIRTPRTAKLLSQAGADILVVGTRIEEDPSSNSLKNIINSISTRS
jgi:phosphoglycerol geranylgeranyltransferase